jgi:tRNA(Ile)-lysidine synthase
VERLARELERDATVSADRGSVILRRERLSTFPRHLRAEVLRRAWRRAGWPEAGMGAERWWRLADLAGNPGMRASVGGGVEVTTDRESFILRRIDAPTVQTLRPIDIGPIPLDVPGSARWGGGRVVATLDPDAPRDESVDLDRLAPPLWVRSASPGDRFEPLGMGGRSTPLNDFFRGRRIPRADRPRIPLVCDRDGIIWVVGQRISHRVRRTDETCETVGLRWEAGEMREE